VTETLRVAPLFETLDDLHNSEASMESLLSNKWYCDQIGGRQECMIGYSDSGKDAGRLAAAWGLYEVQVMLWALWLAHFGLACLILVSKAWCHIKQAEHGQIANSRFSCQWWQVTQFM